VSERERIARIVDPEAFEKLAFWSANGSGSFVTDHAIRECEALVNDALAKADAILARPEPSEAVVGLYYAIKLCVSRIERPNLSPGADVVLERARAAVAAYEAERGE
jgi:hypothetical protein